MKSILAALATVPLCCGLMMAQNMSYTGRLVAAGCRADLHQPNVEASMQHSDSGTADRMTKPTKGYEEGLPYYTSEENPNYAAQSSKQHQQRSSRNTTGEADREMTNNMPQNCRISSDTRSFALQMEDGRVIPLDRSSNERIYKRLVTGATPDLDNPIVIHGRMQRGRLSMQSMSL